MSRSMNTEHEKQISQRECIKDSYYLDCLYTTKQYKFITH